MNPTNSTNPPPQSLFQPIRRVGRTCRAGKSGRCTALVVGRQVGLARQVAEAVRSGRRLSSAVQQAPNNNNNPSSSQGIGGGSGSGGGGGRDDGYGDENSHKGGRPVKPPHRGQPRKR